MNRDSVAKLRLDRRLLNRRGWISQKEREQALAELPDAAAKSTTLGRAADERSGSDDAESGESSGTQ
jgi:hypothetical protein